MIKIQDNKVAIIMGKHYTVTFEAHYDFIIEIIISSLEMLPAYLWIRRRSGFRPQLPSLESSSSPLATQSWCSPFQSLPGGGGISAIRITNNNLSL